MARIAKAKVAGRTTAGRGRPVARKATSASRKSLVRGSKARAVRGSQKGGSHRGGFATLRRGGGMGVSVNVVEGVGGEWDQRGGECEVVATKGGGLSGVAVGRLRRALQRLAPALAALGHSDRARMMAKLLEGPATYRALQKVTKMKAGPLYYHLGELRSAGLILPKQRDLYELTRGGRNLALVMAASESLVRDKRRRPVGDITS